MIILGSYVPSRALGDRVPSPIRRWVRPKVWRYRIHLSSLNARVFHAMHLNTVQSPSRQHEHGSKPPNLIQSDSLLLCAALPVLCFVSLILFTLSLVRRREQYTISIRARGGPTGRRAVCVSLVTRCDPAAPRYSSTLYLCDCTCVELAAIPPVLLVMPLGYRNSAYRVLYHILFRSPVNQVLSPRVVFVTPYMEHVL